MASEIILAEDVLVIARWESPESREITLQNFVVNGQPFIPIFSDEEHFRREAAGSGFERQGVAIKRHFLASILKGDEALVLNPGSANLQLSVRDLEVGRINIHFPPFADREGPRQPPSR